MLLRTPTPRWTVAVAWLPAVAGCGVLAGYALSRPATWHAQAAALLDVTAVLVIAALAARLLPARWPVRPRDVAAPLLLCLLLVTRPVREAVLAGDLSPCAAALVLYALPARRPRHTDGLALAVAVALAPVWALFAVLPWRTGRRRLAVAAVSLGGAVTVTRWLLDGHPTAGAWLRRLAGPVPTSASGRLDDYSVRGMLLRLGVHGGTLLACWLVVVGLVVAAATVRATRYGRDGQTLLAIGVLGCAVVVATPVAWSYDLLWLLAAAAGRLGRRVEDRAVWPVVAILPALFTSALFDPNIEPVTSFALRNAPGLLAVLVAAILPFRLRSAPDWRVARTVVPVRRRPLARRRLQLLPAWLQSVRRPNLLLELLLIQVGYGVYTWIRNAAPNRVGEAVGHGQDILRAERLLHVDVEHTLNKAMLASDWLTDFLENYYKTLHFAVPLAILAWLYWRRPHQYRPARTVLFTSTGLALIGFWAYPLAPPRLTPGHGFRDSLRPGGDADPFGALTKLANQFAAMPSLHVGWSTWCALVLVTTAPYVWVRILGALYPVATFLVILATANHWLLDAVGALATLGIAYLLQFLLTGQHLGEEPAVIGRRSPARRSRPSSPGRYVSS